MMTYEDVLDVIAESEIADDERSQWLDLLPELDEDQLNSVGEMFEKQIVEKEALTQRQELELLAMIKKVEDESPPPTPAPPAAPTTPATPVSVDAVSASSNQVSPVPAAA